MLIQVEFGSQEHNMNFKEFLKEGGTKGVPVISIDKTHVNLKEKNTLDEVNKNLDQALSIGFVNPYQALEKASKILSFYGLSVPKAFHLNEPEGAVVFEMTQFAQHTGWSREFNNVVNGIQASGDYCSPGEAMEADKEFALHFTYGTDENGIFSCEAEVTSYAALQNVSEEYKKILESKEPTEHNHVADYHGKSVQGLYNYAHYEHPSGTFIQVRHGNNPHQKYVHFDGKKNHHFDTVLDLKTHVNNFHNKK